MRPLLYPEEKGSIFLRQVDESSRYHNPDDVTLNNHLSNIIFLSFIAEMSRPR
jgi:hypothetical protein